MKHTTPLIAAALALLLVSPAAAQRHATDRPFEEDKLALLDGLIEEAGALAKKNEHARARMIAWAVWAQCYAERGEINYRYAAKRTEHAKRTRRIAAIEAKLAEAVYGPAPDMAAFKPDADIVDVLTAVKLGKAALAAKNYYQALQVVKFVGTRIKGGLKIPEQKQADAINGFFKQYKTEARTAFSYLSKHHFDVLKTIGLRGREGGPENRLLEMWRNHKTLKVASTRSLMGRDGKVLISSHRIYKGLVQDMARGEKALLKLCEQIVDPRYGGFWVSQSLKNAAKKRNRAYERQIFSFLAAVRAVVFWKRLCKQWDYPEHIGRAWLKYVAGCLIKAERMFQNDQTEAGRKMQTEASEGLKLAVQMQAPAKQVEARKAQVAALEGLVGAGKLKRATASLARAEKLLAYAVRSNGEHDLDEPLAKLEAAATWIEKAKGEGATAGALAPVEARLKKARAAIPTTWAGMTRRELKSAGEYVARAEKQWAKGGGEDAYLADQYIRRATKYQAQAAKLAPHAKDADLTGEVAALAAKLKGMTTETIRRQRHPKDVYTGSSGSSWRSRFRARAGSKGEVLKLSIVNADWTEKEARYEYGKWVEIRYHKEIYAWVAFADPSDPKRAHLRCLGFRLHKFTDGSYRKLKMHYVGRAIPMLRENLK